MTGRGARAAGWPLALQLALGFTLVIALALGGGGTFLLERLQTRQLEQRRADVLTKARAVAALTSEGRFTQIGPTLSQVLYDFHQQSGMRPVVVDRDGIVKADSWTPSPLVGKPLLLPEVQAALAGREATGLRAMAPGGKVLYAAVPLTRSLQMSGAVLLSADLNDLDRSFADVRRQFLWVLTGAGLLALGVSLALARYLSRPLVRLSGAAATVAGGRLDVRVQPGGSQEVRALGAQFNQMAAELTRQDEQRRHFVAAASHEMRTPVASIRALADALLTDTTGDVTLYKELLGDVVQECEHAAHLVDRMLELARLEARGGQRGAPPAPLDLGALVRSRVARLERLARERAVALSAAGPDALVVSAEAWLVETVLDNLVGNAVKYTPARGQVTVTLSGPAAGEVRIAVADTGAGIAPEHLPHLFERFYRVDKSRARATGGVGLGLTIAAEAAAQLGGRIEVQSEVGRGSVFTLVLRAE